VTDSSWLLYQAAEVKEICSAPYSVSSPASEDILQPELNLTLLSDSAADLPKPGCVYALASHGCAGVGKVCVIESVEELRSELYPALFSDPEVLEQANVPGLQ
jgi:hypothetical protein